MYRSKLHASHTGSQMPSQMYRSHLPASKAVEGAKVAIPM